MKGPLLERRGIEVRYCEALYPRNAKKNDLPFPPGWYIFVESSEGMVAMTELRFFRNKDAQLSCNALRLAGLDNVRRLREAGGKQVLQLTMEALQW